MFVAPGSDIARMTLLWVLGGIYADIGDSYFPQDFKRKWPVCALRCGGTSAATKPSP